MFYYNGNGNLQVKDINQLYKKIKNCNKYLHNKVVKKDILFFELCDLFIDSLRIIHLKLTNIYQMNFYEEEEIKKFMREIIKYKKEHRNTNLDIIINLLLIEDKKINNNI